jgi:thioredoxin reductase (NADPH)
VVDDIFGQTEPFKKVTSVRLKSTVDDSTRDMAIDGVFVAIGHKPNSELFSDVLELDDNGYIKVLPHSTKTAIPGLFVCGDVADSVYRQAVTAAGTGCMAAIDAERFLESQGH